MFRVPCFVFLVSCSGSGVPGSRFRVSGSRFRASDFESRDRVWRVPHRSRRAGTLLTSAGSRSANAAKR
jgi:hypothetical protein